jgi:hypothetical protein
LGHYLLPDEVVHHINYNKLDNQLDNLVVLTQAQHEVVHLEHKRMLQKIYWTTERRAARSIKSKEYWKKIKNT